MATGLSTKILITTMITVFLVVVKWRLNLSNGDPGICRYQRIGCVFLVNDET